MPADPFDWTGGPFLLLYLGLFAASALVSKLLADWARNRGAAAPVHGELPLAYLAYLAGGRARVVASVSAKLLQQGALELRRTRLVAKEDGAGRPAIEQALLKAADNVRWPAVHGRMRRQTRALEAELVTHNLILPDSARLWLRCLQALPFALLGIFGLIKWQAGMARERPVGFLTALLGLTAITAVVRFVSIDRRTRAGRAALRSARADNERLQRAPTEDELELAVALFGTGVLAATPLAPFHTLCRRNPGTSTDNSSGCGTGDSSGDSGSSDSGCGGGGCGGCGD